MTNGIPEREIKAKTWLLFVYCFNGINPADIASLTWDRVKETYFWFIREKTKRTTKKKPIQIKPQFTPTNKPYFTKYARKKEDNNYMFPILEKGMSTEAIKKAVHAFDSQICRVGARIAKELGFTKKLTPYVMRHTFATVSNKKGVNQLTTSRNLGHQDFKATQIYMGLADDIELQEAAALL